MPEMRRLASQFILAFSGICLFCNVVSAQTSFSAERKRIVTEAVAQNPADLAVCEGGEGMFTQEMALLKQESLLSFDLNKINQIPINSHNWGGPSDASLMCDVGFTPNAMVVAGNLRDNMPFLQPTLHPMSPKGMLPPYCADGVEFVLEDATSASRKIRYVLDFSSACLRPRLMLYESVFPETMGCITDAYLRVTPASNTDGSTHFEFTIPYECLADPRFFNIPLKVTVRFHDLDGDLTSYLMMEQTLEKK